MHCGDTWAWEASPGGSSGLPEAVRAEGVSGTTMTDDDPVTEFEGPPRVAPVCVRRGPQVRGPASAY